jgi:hypothetical protein
MRKIFFTPVLLLTGIVSGLNAQDVITKRDGSEILTKVIAKEANTVKYKMFDNLSGPDYVLQKSEILEIRYESGRSETFASATTATTTRTERATGTKTESPVITAEGTAAKPVTGTARPSSGTAPSQSGSVMRQPPAQYPYSNDWKSRMKIDAPDIYQKYRKGNNMAGFGLGLAAGGLISAIVGVATADKTTSATPTGVEVRLHGSGGAVFAAGMICVCAGTPVMIVGFSKRNKAKRQYLSRIENTGDRQVSPLQLPHLEVRTNGIAFVF